MTNAQRIRNFEDMDLKIEFRDLNLKILFEHQYLSDQSIYRSFILSSAPHPSHRNSSDRLYLSYLASHYRHESRHPVLLTTQIEAPSYSAVSL